MTARRHSKKRAVIVSGGTYGIGRHIVAELARQGWPVVAFGIEARQPGSLAENGIRETHEVLAQAGRSAVLMEADVSVAADVDRVLQRTLREHPGIAAVVNNAAIRPQGSVLETDEACFDRVLAVNLKGPFLLARAALPHLRAGGGGTIVNVGSGASRGRAGLAAYSASKAGLQALTVSMARDHERDHVRVFLVVPPPKTASGMIEFLTSEAAADRTSRETESPGGASSPAEVARVVAHLLSNDAREPTGSVIEVAGFRAGAAIAGET